MTDEAFVALTGELQECLDTENAAKTRRNEIENELAGLFEGETPEDGSKTVERAGVRLFIRREVNYTADTEALKTNCPETAQEIIRIKEEVNKTALKKLMGSDPAAFARVSPFITSKPAKPYVRLSTKKGEK
jgi:hypothetical protein